MKRIRCGSGLGDNIYLQSIVRHLVDRGMELEVCTGWPMLFKHFGDRVKVAPFEKVNIDIVAHYVSRKAVVGTDQFEDMCISAGIADAVELKLEWQVRDTEIVRKLRAAGRPILVVQMPRPPMARTDGFADELLPDCRVIQKAIDRLKGSAFLVQIGSGESLFKFDGIDLDLANQTTIEDLLDIASVAAGFLGYCSFIIPMAEGQSKPILLVWSRRGLKSRTPFIRRITPTKILHRQTSMWVVDDDTNEKITGTVDAFRRTISGS